jgi:hypothetical protein
MAVRRTGIGRGLLPGMGGGIEGVHAAGSQGGAGVHFEHYIRQMIEDTKAAALHHLAPSLTVRIMKDGKVERGSGRFSA